MIVDIQYHTTCCQCNFALNAEEDEDEDEEGEEDGTEDGEKEAGKAGEFCLTKTVAFFSVIAH